MNKRSLYPTLVLVSTCLLFGGCGDDDGGGPGGPEPVTGVEISADKSEVEIAGTAEITAVVTGGDTQELTWSVNGIDNGNEVYGTITQNSPVTYNAPDSLPPNTNIVIGAISVENETMMDTCHIHLKFTKIFVDADTGDDATGTGSVNLPLKSITHGLAEAQAGMTVLVRPGVYDQANGEVFELVLPESVALVGMDWETCIIRGHGTGSYNAPILMEERGTSLRKFTLEMGEPADPKWDIVVRVRGDAQLVDSIRVLDRGNFSVLRVGATENTVIQNCYFVADDGNRWYRGFEVTSDNQNLILRGCTVSGYYQGIFINGLQDPLIEGCDLSGNDKCLGLWFSDTSDPNPDLGGGARGSAGGNIFMDYTDCGLSNPTSNAIYAKFNTWDNTPPIEGVDYCNTGTGSVITE